MAISYKDRLKASHEKIKENNKDIQNIDTTKAKEESIIDIKPKELQEVKEIENQNTNKIDNSNKYESIDQSNNIAKDNIEIKVIEKELDEKIDNINNKSNLETKEVMIVPTLQELQDKNFEGYSLSDIIKCFSYEIEKSISNCGSDREILDFTEGKAKSFEEKHPKKSYPALPEIHTIIDIITKRTPLKKYEVFERLILNGLKYTNFNK